MMSESSWLMSAENAKLRERTTRTTDTQARCQHGRPYPVRWCARGAKTRENRREYRAVVSARGKSWRAGDGAAWRKTLRVGARRRRRR